MSVAQPLGGVRVVDFTTLLPGPLATLMLAESGAEVIKIERPGSGDEARRGRPRFGPDGVDFALLNRCKRSIQVDLKDPAGHDAVLALVDGADVVVEQFRPGVMDRLGLGYEALSTRNPRLVYCAITGYGQSGPKCSEAGHDLNYIADTGLMSLGAGAGGMPSIPQALIADITAGSYPAVVNILLALRVREATGRGTRVDVSMTDNLFPLMFWALGQASVPAEGPVPWVERLGGNSPRYRLYRTRDGAFLAAAPLEERFWEVFCEVIGLAAGLRDDRADPKATIARVEEIVASRDAQHWREAFAGRDACCNVVRTLSEALADPHYRGLFGRTLAGREGTSISALPVAVSPQFQGAVDQPYPALGEANEAFGVPPPAEKR